MRTILFITALFMSTLLSAQKPEMCIRDRLMQIKEAIYFIIAAFRNALPHVRSYFVITIFQFMSRIYNPVPNKIEQAIFLKSI